MFNLDSLGYINSASNLEVFEIHSSLLYLTNNFISKKVKQILLLPNWGHRHKRYVKYEYKFLLFMLLDENKYLIMHLVLDYKLQFQDV